MVQRAITQTRWRPPSCFREYFWDGAVVVSSLQAFIKHNTILVINQSPVNINQLYI
jgi:hypothetical protein